MERENQRIRITRQCLRDSLVRLLQEKSIHKISVREICDSAAINRTTFYKYYGSQYDLLKDMEDDTLQKIADYLCSIDSGTDDAQRVMQILLYAQDNLDLFRLLINNTTDSDFPQKLLSLPSIQNVLREHLAGGFDPLALDYVYHFIVHGGFNMIKVWINKQHRESPGELTSLLMKVVAKMLT